MARLTTPLAATTFAPLWRLKPKPITGGLEEFRQLSAELLDFLLLLLAMLEQGKKSSSNADRCGGPGRF
jgi:hypothetical protein